MTSAKFPWSEAEIRRKVGESIRAMWSGRAALGLAQAAAGRRVDDSRGGRHLDPFIATLVELARGAGFDEDEVRVGTGIEVPGFYRPTKRWDLVVVRANRLCAAVEFKSMSGAYGKNLNNRSEEALGSATDVWAAFNEGTLGNRSPWLGYLFLICDEDESNAPVAVARGDLATDPVFEGNSYIDRYGILCERMVRKRVYSAASFLAAPRGDKGDFREPRPGLGFGDFARSFYGHLLGWSGC